MTAAQVIYLLCAAASLLTAGLLLRQHARNRSRLLFWSSVGFLGLAANNVLLFVDLTIFPNVDLSLLRTALGAAAVLVLAFGLMWESNA